MTEQDRVRDAVETLSKEFNSSLFDSRYTMIKEAGLLLIAIANRYLSGELVDTKVLGDGKLEEVINSWGGAGYNKADIKDLANSIKSLFGVAK